MPYVVGGSEMPQIPSMHVAKRRSGAWRVLPVTTGFGSDTSPARLTFIFTTQGELNGRDVIIVGSTHGDAELLELVRVGSQLAATTHRRIFVIPFCASGV